MYEVNGCRYLQIIDFHQKVRSKSKFPDPLSDLSATCQQSASNLSTDCQQLVDKMPALGVCEGGIRIADAKAGGLVTMPSPTERLIGETVERMYSRHPKKKELALVPDALSKAVVMEADPAAKLKEIETVHEAWSETEGWTKKNGDFAPKLAEWISDKGFTKWPAGREPPKPKPIITQAWRPFDPSTLENLHERE